MAVTLQDIADHVGLSRPTVTRILGKDAHLFRPETRKKVIEAAKRLGYRPNAAAKAMGKGSFGCAALVLSYSASRSDLPVPLLMGVQDELARHEMHLAVARLPDDELTRKGVVPKILRESMADGMIINYTHDIPKRMLELIRFQAAPVVWVNTDLEFDSVRPDDLNGARQLTERLLAAGHRRVLYTKFDASSHYSGPHRAEGYATAMRKAGLTPQIVDRLVPAAEQPEFIRALLVDENRPTAVIARPEDVPSFAIVAAELGMKVPRDLSLAAISGRFFTLMGLEASIALVPASDEGVEAVKMLREKMEDPDRPLPQRPVPFLQFGGATIVPPPPPPPRLPRGSPSPDSPAPAARATRSAKPKPA